VNHAPTYSQGPTPRRRRVLFVGLGQAAGLALAALEGRDDVEIVAGVDPLGVDGTGRLGAGVPVLTSLEALPEAEIAIVSTPTPTHADVCAGVLERGRGLRLLLCEKPFTLAPCEGRRLMADARGRGVDLRVLLHYAFAAEVLWLAERLSEFGDVAAFEALFEDPYGDAFADRTAVLVSSWADSGINALSVLARLVQLERVVASTGDRSGETAATLAFVSGATESVGTITTRWRVGRRTKRTTLVVGDGTVLALDHEARSVSAGGRIAFQAHGDARLERYRTMLDAHLADAPTVHDTESVLRMHELLVAALGPEVSSPTA
jgi:predicted dehydrogenase